MQVHDGFSTLTQISRSRLPANKAKTGCCPFRRSRLQSDHAEQSDTGICRLSWTERTGVHIFLYDVPKQTFFQSPTTSNRKPRITVLYGLLGFVLRLLSNVTGDVAMIFRYRQHLSILYLHFQQLRSRMVKAQVRGRRASYSSSGYLIRCLYPDQGSTFKDGSPENAQATAVDVASSSLLMSPPHKSQK